MLNELKIDVMNNLQSLLLGAYSQHTGWMKLPEEKDLDEIINVANTIKENYEALVVIGVGGSYLGSKAVIEAITNKHHKEVEVIYIGNNLSHIDMSETIRYLSNKRFAVNVISKSGSTIETSMAFEVIKEMIPEHEFNKRIIITTSEQNELSRFAETHNSKVLTIPLDIGGRYSVFTPAGLLPMAVANVNIKRLIAGAKGASLTINPNKDSIATDYALQRVELYKKGYAIEIMATYENKLKSFGEWWKQLFGESEGKDGKGLFPHNATFTTDLHSLGQLIQDGKRNLIETHITFNYDNFEPLKGHYKKIYEMNKVAEQATMKAHSTGGVPIIHIPLERLNAETMGLLMYQMMVACAVSAMTIDVNPFDQPGVESYKKNMKEILSKNNDSFENEFKVEVEKILKDECNHNLDTITTMKEQVLKYSELVIRKNSGEQINLNDHADILGSVWEKEFEDLYSSGAYDIFDGELYVGRNREEYYVDLRKAEKFADEFYNKVKEVNEIYKRMK